MRNLWPSSCGATTNTIMLKPFGIIPVAASFALPHWTCIFITARGLKVPRLSFRESQKGRFICLATPAFFILGSGHRMASHYIQCSANSHALNVMMWVRAYRPELQKKTKELTRQRQVSIAAFLPSPITNQYPRQGGSPTANFFKISGKCHTAPFCVLLNTIYMIHVML